jgi:glutamyl-Q tRNA(Asp) synthetase
LHLGSLVAALGSFLEARRRDGRWLLRMEDLDAPRVVPGAAAEILRTLERLHLHWDGEVLYQSGRREHYVAALEALMRLGVTFECSCSRRDIGELGELGERPYPGTCRGGARRSGPTATRLRIEDGRRVRFEDRFQGNVEFELQRLGDVVLRRRDSRAAYQLAVVVDDAAQGVNDVVRGADLLASTAWQLELYRYFRLPEPTHAHLPLLVEPDGNKLAKSRRSLPVDLDHAGQWLVLALRALEQEPPAEFVRERPEMVLAWALNHWRPDRFHGLQKAPAPEIG